jgi:hypothetical protein
LCDESARADRHRYVEDFLRPTASIPVTVSIMTFRCAMDGKIATVVMNEQIRAKLAAR